MLNITSGSEHPVGQLQYNGADVGLKFQTGATAGLTQTFITWEYDGVGSDWLAASYIRGTGPTFRTTSFPFSVSASVLSTANPCELKVRCEFRIDAWAPFPQSRVTQTDTVTHSGDFIIVANPQNSGLGGGPYRWNSLSVAVFERVVPAWPHEPPTINFTSADLVSSPETWNVITGFSSSVLNSAPVFQNKNDMTYQVDYDTVSVATTSIAFTLQAHSAPRVPHP